MLGRGEGGHQGWVTVFLPFLGCLCHDWRRFGWNGGLWQQQGAAVAANVWFHIITAQVRDLTAGQRGGWMKSWPHERNAWW